MISECIWIRFSLGLNVRWSVVPRACNRPSLRKLSPGLVVGLISTVVFIAAVVLAPGLSGRVIGRVGTADALNANKRRY